MVSTVNPDKYGRSQFESAEDCNRQSNALFYKSSQVENIVLGKKTSWKGEVNNSVKALILIHRDRVPENKLERHSFGFTSNHLHTCDRKFSNGNAHSSGQIAYFVHVAILDRIRHVTEMPSVNLAKPTIAVCQAVLLVCSIPES